MTRGSLTASKELKYLLTSFIQADAEVIKHTSRDTFSFTDKSKQNMLSANIRMTQFAGFVHRQLNHFFSARSISNVRRLFLTSANQCLHFVLDFFKT